ncbi:class I SAM-dependent methyltransferase [Tateyamaria sp. Alg231-49]|uniref:class I SAM-dependent methyltransferase n=1 Tax=Tateyamaria sp. Alg231-49 TaxID=1922219 RepID=UPI000D54BF5D|nr:class I SAM-dependent methyltransferase [Tateyamaria sp. Alg231-49]
MQHPDITDTQLYELERRLADDIGQVARSLDVPPHIRDPEDLRRAWRKTSASHSILRTLIKDILRDTSDQDKLPVARRRALRDLKSNARAIRRQLLDWARVSHIIEHQHAPSDTDLVQVSELIHGPQDVLDHVTALFMHALHKIANPSEHTQSASAEKDGLYRDIPLPMSQFSSLIGAAYRLCLAQRKTHPLRFLDVGSGGGTKVLAATTCFDVCHGLEYEAHTFATGSQVLEGLGADRCTLFHGNAFEFEDYGNYDVIYYFRPMQSNPDMIALEARILAQARPGSFLCVPGEMATPNHDAAGARNVSGHVYATGMSKEEVDDLHFAARHIGTSVPGFYKTPPRVSPLLEPLLKACARNGYRI